MVEALLCSYLLGELLCLIFKFMLAINGRAGYGFETPFYCTQRNHDLY